MIQEHIWYTTSDGQGFLDKEQAEDWEKILQSDWYKVRKLTNYHSSAGTLMDDFMLLSIMF